MHRFRKKSDAKRSPVPQESLTNSPTSPPTVASSTPPRVEAISALLPATDFRTSLILPSLSRRFSLLRNQNGDPLPLDSVRSRLAEQRARGADLQMTEEEEDVMIQALSSIRVDRDSSGQEDLFNLHSDSTGSGYNASASDSSHFSGPQTGGVYSSPSLYSSVSNISTPQSAPLLGDMSSSPPSLTSKTGKRVSNNLFGSGRFQDTSYLHSVKNASNRSLESSASLSSINAPTSPHKRSPTTRRTENQESGNNSSSTASVPSSPHDEKTPVARTTVLPPTSSNTRPVLTAAQVRRASLALEAAIRGLEEDEETIIAPRSAPLSAGIPYSYHSPVMDATLPEQIRDEIAEGRSEQNRRNERDTYASTPSPYPRSSTTSPTPRIPGYIPGMHRPITPRGVEPDEFNRNSSTPRANSPYQVGERIPGGILANKKRPSHSSTSQSTSALPSEQSMRRSRSRADHSSSDDLSRSASESPAPPRSSLMDRRRPASPFTQIPLRSIISRPTTPASLVNSWAVSPSSGKFPRPDKVTSPTRGESNVSAHSRRGSVSSAVDAHTEGFLQRSRSNARSVVSPALPDSPLLDGENSPGGYFGFATEDGRDIARPGSAISGFDLGRTSPLLTRSVRSPTPNYLLQRSPSSNGYHHEDPRPPGANGRRSPKPSHTPSSSSSSNALQNPLVLSPMLNSSRSSLVSVGSSYHSEAGDESDELRRRYGSLSILMRQDDAAPVQAWDETIWGEKRDPTASAVAQEDLLHMMIGLKKKDLAMLQAQLVEAAIAKKNSEAMKTPQRRTRSSISRSIDSRAASPSPPKQVPSATPPADAAPPLSPILSQDNAIKAHTLLTSVVNSIQPPLPIPVLPLAQPEPEPILPQPQPEPEPEPEPEPILSADQSTLRTKALAEALFGPEDKEVESVPTDSSESSDLSRRRSLRELESALKSPVTPPMSPPSQQIVEDVWRKATAATAALKSPTLRKMPSQPGLADTSFPLRRRSTKRIDVQQIGSPKLLPSSNVSVDTIPLPMSPPVPSSTTGAMNNGATDKAPSKLSLRFKKALRGTLRTKSTPNGEEITPWTPESSTTGAQIAQYDPQKLNQPKIMSVPAGSSTDLIRQQSTSSFAPSPPASAGIKGFMARLRSKPKKDMALSVDELAKRPNPSSGPLRTATRSPSISRMLAPSPNPDEATTVSAQQMPPAALGYASPPVLLSPSSGSISRQQLSPSPSFNQSFAYPSSQRTASRSQSPEGQQHPVADPPQSPRALQQFYEAASSLGVDHTALSAFLAQSGTSSATTNWPQSPAFSVLSPPIHDVPEEPPAVIPPQPSTSLGRQPSSASSNVATRARPLRHGQTTQDVNSAVVRRTIIYPSEAELNALTRKPSVSSHKRQRSSISSAKSIQERTPTPPPSRNGGSRRFSKEQSPPVPQLPLKYSMEGRYTPLPTDGRSRAASPPYHTPERKSEDDKSSPGQHGDDAAADGATALELLELANGEVIWNIVDSLRSVAETDLGYDDEDDSLTIFRNRASVWSQQSSVPSDDLQMTFKAHRRQSSKASNSSSKLGQSTSRPETKVFFSSSANIERMIESMSKGVDAGSFNIVPNTPVAATGFNLHPEANWTVEERLEHLLTHIHGPGTAR